jgi:thiol:disulfide interchange protein
MRLLISLMLLLTLVGCGAIQKVKTKEKLDITTEVKATSDAVATTVTDTKGGTVTTTTITERIDTVVSVPASKASVSAPLSVLIENGVMEASNNETTVRATYHPETGTIHIEGHTQARSVPVKAERTSKTEANSKFVQSVKKDESLSSSIEESKEVKSTNKEVIIEKKTAKWAWIPILMLLIIVFFIVGVIIGRKPPV